MVNYMITTSGKEKILHVNIVRTYYKRPSQLQKNISDVANTDVHSANSVISLTDDCDESDQLLNTKIFHSLKQIETIRDVKVSSLLSQQQKTKVLKVLDNFQDIFADIPGKTAI